MKKKVILKAITALAAVLLLSSCTKEYPARTDEELMDFLEKMEISVTGEPSLKTIFIPDEFGEVYEKYNELQKEQGFDLKNYRSEEACVYTFDVVSVSGEHRENTQVHIIVCDEKIIGGDIASLALDGQMTPIITK